ncbi:MAG: DUF6265 family protein [Bacteroidota bacterium]
MNKLFSSLTVRKKVALTFLAAMLSLSNLAYAQPDRKNLKSLQWITGTWKIQLKNGNLYETWNYVNDSTFQGRSFIVKSSGDTIPQESIQITLRKKEMYYTPTAKGQNNDQPVPFKIATMEKNGFVSEKSRSRFSSANHLFA